MSEGTHVSAYGSSIFLLLILSLIVFGFAKKGGFFKLNPPFYPPWPTIGESLGGFLVYLFVSILIAPIIVLLLFFSFTGTFTIQIKMLPEAHRGWIQWGVLLLTFVALVLYLIKIRREVARWILWGKAPQDFKTFGKNVGMGALTWLISYPFVLLANLLSGFLSEKFWGKSGVEQVAVKNLLSFKAEPFLFVAMLFMVILLVPFMEELLFRGFLQSWLRRKMGRMGALFLTAIIFACVHFSPSQGIGNFELILTLFVLSCFLGFIYERQQSLWASFGLHMTFNGFNALILAFQK